MAGAAVAEAVLRWYPRPMTDTTIASRRLTLVPSGRPVLVELDAPVPRRSGEWACAWRIRGIGRARTGRAVGEDGLQALQLALTAVRRALDPFADRLTWTGEPGELGLPEPIPDYFGGGFRRRLERLVQLETEREAQRLKEAALR
jgi:hypothetical protein